MELCSYRQLGILHVPCLYFADCALLKPVDLHFKLPVHGAKTHTWSMLTQTDNLCPQHHPGALNTRLANSDLRDLFTVGVYVHVTVCHIHFLVIST